MTTSPGYIIEYRHHAPLNYPSEGGRLPCVFGSSVVLVIMYRLPAPAAAQSLDVSLGSLKPEGHVSAFSCDVTGRYAVLADSQGLAIMVRSR